MTRSYVPILSVLCMLAAACAGPPSAPPGPRPSWPVGLESYGPIRYGATVEEASRALASPLRPIREYRRGCAFYGSESLPSGVSVMVQSGRVMRVDVSGDAGVRTAEGVGVGSKEDEVFRLYPGPVRAEPHAYAGPAARYLIYTPATAAGDTATGVVFETDGRGVVEFRAGLWPEVAAVEGCL